MLSLFYLRINPFGDNNRLLPRVNSLDMFMCDVQSLYRMNRRFFSRLYGSCISLYDIRIPFDVAKRHLQVPYFATVVSIHFQCDPQILLFLDAIH